jgi:hypothetical protein
MGFVLYTLSFNLVYRDTWLQIMNYSLLYGPGLSSFVAKARDDVEMLVSFARYLTDFCGVCTDLAPVSSSFSPVSIRRCLVALLSRSDQVDLPLLTSSWMDASCAWNYVPVTFTTEFYPTLYSGTTFQIWFYTNAVNQYIESYRYAQR